MPVQSPATPDASLVMRWDQRFESARRLSLSPAKSVKTESLLAEHRELRQQYVSSRLLSLSASSRAPVCCKWLQGIAGGVGGSSSMDRWTDVPGFRRVRHRRKTSARVPRRQVLRTSALRRSEKFGYETPLGENSCGAMIHALPYLRLCQQQRRTASATGERRWPPEGSCAPRARRGYTA